MFETRTKKFPSVLRCQQFWNAQIVNVSRILAVCAYVSVIVFLVIVNIFSSGLGLHNYAICSRLIYTCLGSYAFIKLSLYLFMAERIHTVRSVELSRWQDRVWIATCIIVVVGLGTVIGLGLGLAMFTLDASGACYVGVPNKVTITGLAFDIPVNLWIIGCFVWLLRPTLRSELHNSTQMSSFSRMVAGASLVASAPATQTTGAQQTLASIDLESSLDHITVTIPLQEVRVSVEFDKGIHGNRRKRSSSTLFHALAEDPDLGSRRPLHHQVISGGEEKQSFDLAQFLSDEPQLATRGFQPLPPQQGPLRRPSSPVDFMAMLDESAPPYPPIQGHSVSKPADTPLPFVKRLERLIKRNLIATLILFVPILINVGLYWVFNGKELAWVCLVMCSVDVTSSIAVLHWLTDSSEETA